MQVAVCPDRGVPHGGNGRRSRDHGTSSPQRVRGKANGLLGDQIYDRAGRQPLRLVDVLRGAILLTQGGVPLLTEV